MQDSAYRPQPSSYIKQHLYYLLVCVSKYLLSLNVRSSYPIKENNSVNLELFLFSGIFKDTSFSSLKDVLKTGNLLRLEIKFALII